MLVTFKSSAYGEFTMFGNMAKRLLQLMGMSGTVPGAINAEDIPAALDQLIKAMDTGAEIEEEKANDGEENEKQQPVTVAARAYPLVEMLKASQKENCSVMWYE